ncbi:heparinase II/III-family protein, partial [Sandarakinorhabdus sp.]|uniref:heparinase II/III-family protein n=1 Tax=Sandarakinorhabdus sp. TaxID=1916663 RepID=UPI00286D9C01
HGGAAIGPEPLERLARRAATGAALARSGRWSGYYRLSAGKTVLVIDAGPPPAPRMAGIGHTGTLAFEMSDGPDRLVTNCGGSRGLPAPLAGPLAAGLCTTAAHSTLVIADTNSTRIRDDGTLGAGVSEVAVQLRTSEAGQWLDASHDGYARRFGMLVRRRLFLSPDGQDLRGEDVIEPVPGKLLRRSDRDFDIRFHLGPGVSATPTADGAGALIKLPHGKVWAFKVRFDAAGGQVSIEPSLWVDQAGTIQKTQQLVISARTHRAGGDIGWSFRRAGK